MRQRIYFDYLMMIYDFRGAGRLHNFFFDNMYSSVFANILFTIGNYPLYFFHVPCNSHSSAEMAGSLYFHLWTDHLSNYNMTVYSCPILNSREGKKELYSHIKHKAGQDQHKKPQNTNHHPGIAEQRKKIKGSQKNETDTST